MTLVGYHGTDKRFAEKIKTEGYNYSSSENWFGKGVYFFKDYYTLCNGCQEAYNWARHVKKLTDIVVFKSIIESDLVLDLLSSIEDRQCFDKIKKQALKKHQEAGLGIKDFNLNVVFIKLEEFCQVIIALVDGARFEGFHNYVVRKPQAQVCVKEKACIIDTTVVNGYF